MKFISILLITVMGPLLMACSQNSSGSLGRVTLGSVRAPEKVAAPAAPSAALIYQNQISKATPSTP